MNRVVTSLDYPSIPSVLSKYCRSIRWAWAQLRIALTKRDYASCIDVLRRDFQYVETTEPDKLYLFHITIKYDIK